VTRRVERQDLGGELPRDRLFPDPVTASELGFVFTKRPSEVNVMRFLTGGRRRGRGSSRAAPRPRPRHVDRTQVAAAHQVRQRDPSRRSVFTRSPGLPRDQRRRHHVAGQPLRGQVMLQPVAARPRPHRRILVSHPWIEGCGSACRCCTVGCDRPQRHHLDAALLRRVGDGDRVLVNIETDVQGLANSSMADLHARFVPRAQGGSGP
jgi:hypothetical protein